MDRHLLRLGAEKLGLMVSEAQLHAFEEYERHLYDVNLVMNLTRIPRDECWSRHFLDSLLFQNMIPMASRVLDIGTGPGFPAWPLALARPDLHVTALDSNGKMLNFLRSNPLPNLEPVQVRAEEYAVREHFDVVTGRAVAPLTIQLELSAAPCRVGGLVIPMRSSKNEAVEVPLLGLGLKETVVRELPGADAVRFFPIYEKVRRTPAQYPRNWAEIKKRPM